jgi:hypothetical protein
MATSGVSVWNLTRNEFISAALRKIGVLGEGVVANATQLAEGQEALNAIISEFETLGLQLWSRTDYPVTLVTSQANYTIGIGQTINTKFPLKILKATLSIPNALSRIDMEIVPHYNFLNLPINSSGPPVNVTYQPFIDYGVLSVWPTPDTSVVAGTQVILTYQKPFDIFTGASETLEMPREWTNAVIYQLALALSDEYGLPIPDKQWLEKQAEKHLNTAMSAGAEETSMFFFPDYRS